MNPDQLQSVYDEISAGTEAATPAELMTPAARRWLELMRRRRWAAAWLSWSAGGRPSSAAGPAGPPPPPPPPPGDDPATGGTDTPLLPDIRPGGEDTAVPAAFGDGTPGDGTDTTDGPGDPISYHIIAETVRSGAGSQLTTIGDLVRSAASIIVTPGAAQVGGFGVAVPVAASIPFGEGPLAGCWYAMRGTWSQAGGLVGCSALTAGVGVLAHTGLTPGGLYNVSIRKPAAGGSNNCGTAACLTVNGSGQVSGYAGIYDGANGIIYRIDTDLWTPIASGIFGAWVAGTDLTLQRNGATLKIFNNGVAKATVVDATYAGGSPGIACQGTGNFTALWTLA